MRLRSRRVTREGSQTTEHGVVGTGRCGFCGHGGEYMVDDRPPRESHTCEACHASLRYRLQASAISATYGWPDEPFAKLLEQPAFRALRIYEPGVVGPFRKRLRDLPGYLNSYYWPDVALGGEHDGVRCEDLRSLTFSDDSLDLVISSDIFEHVRDPMQAFAELFRVLRPGGFHVFTVPLPWPLRSTTRARVDFSGTDDVFLLPAVYHGSPVDPKGSLVYNDFGMDLPDELRTLGFETATHHGYQGAVTFVSRKPA